MVIGAGASGGRPLLWGRIAVAAALVSAIGYVIQSVLDYISEPAIVGEVEFYGLFGGFAIAALVTGIAAVVTGRKRNDASVLLGLVAIAYVVVAQVIQSLWD